MQPSGTRAATLREMTRMDLKAESTATAGMDEIHSGCWLPESLSPPVLVGGKTNVWLAEFHVSIRTLPYLADHGFQGMVVLPGAFLIALVQKVHREFFHTEAVSLRDIEFTKPVILSDAVASLAVRFEERGDGTMDYTLFEATSDEIIDSGNAQPCARMRVDFTAEKAKCVVSIASTSGVPSSTDGREFYRQLRANGNEYGPQFQTVADISGIGGNFMAHFAELRATPSVQAIFPTPPEIDSASQILAIFNLNAGRTFILKSIGHLTIFPNTGPRPHRAFATLAEKTASGGETLRGSVTAVDKTGAPLWAATDIALAFLGSQASAVSDLPHATRLCVASTFTAEPLEDSLRFWGDHVAQPFGIQFAPYNQVFQQLLDPTSDFRTNRDGFNAIVLNIEDWQRETRRNLLSLEPVRAKACFGERQRHKLPNGAEIVHLNRYETEYVYQEIFEDESYLRHGIEIPDSATVIDIGANIGLFSLFVMSRCKDPTIFAFEPSPSVFDLLRANCAAYGDPAHVQAFNCGVAEAKGSAHFTFYEHSSVFSSFHPDDREDRAAVEAVVRNVLEQELAGTAVLHETDIAELTSQRMRSETFECPLASVSQIIRENRIERIHLLKIDAEKSELGILRGIEEAHWPLIEQIVIEVHDRTRTAVDVITEQLTERGFHCSVVEEKLLEHSGLFNIYATRRTATKTPASGLAQKVEDFCDTLDTFIADSPAPLVLAIAPCVNGNAATLDTAEQRILARASHHPQIRTISSTEILARHRVREFHDAHTGRLGHMPFTREGYAALGTAISRAIFSVVTPPVKVIVLDCDNTLWQGLCGEDGATGVVISPGFRQLQEFMLAQRQAGVLLALCSKNQEADVLAVLDQHPEMILRREHLADWRVNWEPKPDNLRSLAKRFNVGLDSFVFLDDNPLECAAVRAACPEVLVLQVPGANERIPTFLDSIWIFDRVAATVEDRTRNKWYRTSSERDEMRAAAPTLRDFIDGLKLRIEVTEASKEQLPRVAQMTLRTNQFNFTSIRRTEGALKDFIESGAKCLVASVSDRFGDYGIVGAVLYTTTADRFIVDTLLLSCRALGKGVEHHMVADLAGRAIRAGKAIVELRYQHSERNQPAGDFLERITKTSLESGSAFALHASELAELRYNPEEKSERTDRGETNTTLRGAANTTHTFDRTSLSAAMQRLGDELGTIENVVQAIERVHASAQPEASPDSPNFRHDANDLERSLHEIWRKVLAKPAIGLTENFFDAGGTSLKAVMVVAMIRNQLKKDVSIISLFESPTIRLLAEKLDNSAKPEGDESSAGAAAESRGRQRRGKLIKRKTA